MSRHREFNEPEVLEKAMMAFWQQGYEDTSYDDLVKATGVSRYGLYSAFGDKKEFFLKALDYYLDMNRCVMFGSLLEKDAALDDIHDYFSRMVENANDPTKKVGCMLCNTAIELAQFDKDVEDKIHEIFRDTKSVLKRAVKNAITNGELNKETNANETADYLFGLMMGGAMLVRSPIERFKIKNYLKTGLSVLK